ncbi:uncharacterized protein LOC106723326 isoform X1 [Alligator sinensis]|uniref:Uncharacterized protein LOC106723326 isoform X1 n=1 Tax=Alligator sinensis TaxID=38654 RepID=A0A3Q0FVP2_ALLSI|nr:uncharacterized protein LOC106723326 isoform X1 [Alligator sinensis]
MDSAFDIKILVYKIIAGDLLRNADVLVTARGHSVSGISRRFRYLVVIPEFSAADIKDSFNTSDKQMEKCSSESRGESKLLALYAFPVQINMLCDSLRHIPSSCANGGPSVGQAGMLGQEGSCCINIDSDGASRVALLRLPESIKDVIRRLANMSFEHLMLGVRKIKQADLNKWQIDPKLLSKYFSKFICKANGSGEVFSYRHSGIREMFASLYVVLETQSREVLAVCLNAMKIYIACTHRAEMQNFDLFFMALLPYSNIESLLHAAGPLLDPARHILLDWFQRWIAAGLSPTDTLKVFHCLFQLHDHSRAEEVSRPLKTITLRNVALSAAEAGALQYCLDQPALDTIDLQGCELGDEGLEQFSSVIRSCKDVGVLIDTLGSAGAKHLCTALETKRSLKTLHLYDNSVQDEGVETLAQGLWKNDTLRLLNLCSNEFGKSGIQSMEEVKKHRPDLQLVLKVTESEQLLDAVLEMVEEVSGERHTFDKKWLQTRFRLPRKSFTTKGI